MPAIPQQYHAAYLDHERELTIRKTQWGCALGAIFVPLFWFLDRYVFEQQQAQSFLYLRLSCSILMTAFFPFINRPFWRKHFRLSGVVILFFPTATIAGMVYETKGMASPYYAGLILVMMFLAVLLDWTFWQSVASVLLVWTLYVAACLSSHAATDKQTFVNNLFFLVSTGVITVISAKFHSDIRGREFVQRCELAAQKAALEKANREIKEAEMQLVQSEKLASFGLIAAGIMHEINNALTYPKSGLRYLEKKSKHLEPEPQAEQIKVLTKIKDSLDFVGEIVSGLQDFAHPNTEQLGPVPVAEVVNQAKLFLSNKWQGSVQIEQQLTENQIVWANKTKMIQVLMNLLNNSLDALKTKSFTDGEKPTIWIEGRVENGKSILAVRDNGPGIAEQARLKIFDPFFTTKGPGAGTGLGLSICRGIVREANGEITMETEVGKFCEFILKFPVGETIKTSD